VVRDLSHAGVYLAIMLGASKKCWGKSRNLQIMLARHLLLIQAQSKMFSFQTFYLGKKFAACTPFVLPTPFVLIFYNGAL